MTDQVEQSSAAEGSNSEDAGSAASLGLGKSDYIEPDDLKPLEGGGSDPAGQGEDEEDDPDEEFEVGGKKYALPKSAVETLKAERLMHGDYTQKTQGAAKERETFAAEREQFNRQVQTHQQMVKEIAGVVAIDNQLAEYEKVNWDALIATDPQQAMQLQQQQRNLQTEREKAVQQATTKQNEIALGEQQTTAKQIQDARAFFEREIKGWNPELDTEVHKYTLAQGITNDQAVRMSLQAPAIVKLAHKAMLYDRLVAKQAVTKREPTPEVNPAARVGASGSVKKDPTNMTDAEYAAWRRGFQKR